jgi:uncharacterized protein (DUF58 family)
MADESQKGKFLVNFPKVISEFEDAMHRFPVKKILYRNIFRGKGLEFDSYRVFESTDDASMIDWKASLRSNQILAKKYIEERELNVYFLVDVSNGMLFGSGDKLKAEYAAEFAVALAHLVLGAGDKIGLVMFSDHVTKFLPPARSKNQFALFSKFISDTSLYGGGFDADKAVRHVLETIKAPYNVFILISDFLRIGQENLDVMKLMGTRFETMAVMVRDRLDEDLPDTNYQIAVQDPYTGRQMVLDPAIARERYKENTLRQKMLVKDIFKKSRIDLLELSTDKNFVIPVSSFLRGRAMGARV